MRIVLLGAPGAGKGSQAAILSKEYNLPHISTGDAFRKNIANKTEIGIKCHQYVSTGLLVPDEIVIAIVKERLAEDDCKNGYILDGFPRTIEQAKELDKFVDIEAVINIEVGNEVIIKRLSGRRACSCGAIHHTSTYSGSQCRVCGKDLFIREDDKPETVKNRLEVYDKLTAPLIDYYTKQNKIYNVDGTQSVEATFKQISNILSTLK